MGRAYIELKNFDKASEMLNKALSLKPEFFIYYIVRDLYYDIKDYDNFIKVSLAAIKQHIDVSINYYNVACGYSLKNNVKISLEYLKISFEKGYNDYDGILEDTDLTNIRQLPEFKELMKKYFPDQIK